MVSDSTKKGALDARIVLGNILFWLKGDAGIKWALFFDIFTLKDVNTGRRTVYV